MSKKQRKESEAMSLQDEVEGYLKRTLLAKNVDTIADAIMRLVEPDVEKLVELLYRNPRYAGYKLETIQTVTAWIELWRSGALSKSKAHRCPTCGVTQPDAWCGACGIEIPQTYGAAGMSEAAVDGLVEKVREAHTPDKEEA